MTEVKVILTLYLQHTSFQFQQCNPTEVRETSNQRETLTRYIYKSMH